MTIIEKYTDSMFTPKFSNIFQVNLNISLMVYLSIRKKQNLHSYNLKKKHLL